MYRIIYTAFTAGLSKGQFSICCFALKVKKCIKGREYNGEIYSQRLFVSLKLERLSI